MPIPNRSTCKYAIVEALYLHQSATCAQIVGYIPRFQPRSVELALADLHYECNVVLKGCQYSNSYHVRRYFDLAAKQRAPKIPARLAQPRTPPKFRPFHPLKPCHLASVLGNRPGSNDYRAWNSKVNATGAITV